MPERLSIVLVLATPGTTWGGMERHTSDLAAGLADRGHKVTVYGHGDYCGRFTAPILFQPLPVELGRSDPRLVWRLRQLLKQHHPHICHAQGNKAATLTQRATRLMPDAARPLLIGTIHGTKSSVKAYAPLDGAIAVSSDLLKQLDHPRGQLIPNGVTPELRATPSRFEIANGHPLVIAAGRLEPVKQFDRLIEAWGRAGQQGVLVILGEGSERQRLQRQITDLQMVGRVLLPGMETNLKPWFDAATACVISSAREGLSYVMIEALMAGCPVLSTPVSGAGKLLPANHIARSDSIHDLTALLEAALTTPTSLREQQQASFDRARAELTLDAMVNHTETYYHSLLTHRARSAPPALDRS